MTFPVDPPPSLNDPDIIRAHDWQAFIQLDSMENHWSRPDWPEGRRSFHWMLSFHSDTVAQELAGQCQAKLARPELDLVPLDALHITIGRVAFIDKLSRRVIRQLIDAASEQCATLTAFDLSLIPLTGSRGALRFSVAPWSPLLRLHQHWQHPRKQQLAQK
ncbi:hypothetical protein [Actinokineospora spheciospongiae]|uniref:hypothetical protein n=1 Tax=Actinokineospora spheciospongiae TaxID=909613 RepID=UPI0013779AF8|nr:hypothetical protein [Actinokineospora spheciospongiae]